jgi:hypothetical protein
VRLAAKAAIDRAFDDVVRLGALQVVTAHDDIVAAAAVSDRQRSNETNGLTDLKDLSHGMDPFALNGGDIAALMPIDAMVAAGD